LCIAIDHVEQGHEEPPEPAPVKDTNPELFFFFGRYTDFGLLGSCFHSMLACV
jgi:hypothetical protein